MKKSIGVLLLAFVVEGWALDVQFTKIADVPPQDFGAAFSAPYLVDGSVIFSRTDDTGDGTDYGLVADGGDPFVIWGDTLDGAQLNNIYPVGASGTSLLASAFSNHLEGTSTYYGSLFIFESGIGRRVVDKLTPVPGFTSPLRSNPGGGSIDGSRVAFLLPEVNIDPRSDAAVCVLEGGVVTVIARQGDTIPGSQATFVELGAPYASDGSVVFYGRGLGTEGFFSWTPADGLSVLVNSSTQTPDGTMQFGSSFETRSIVRREDEYAFVTDGFPTGVYKIVDGIIEEVATSQTEVPGGEGVFYDFFNPSIDNGKVVVLGWRDNRFALPLEYGIYSDFAGKFEPIVDVHTTLDGKTPISFDINRGLAFFGNDVFFHVRFGDGSDAVYKATIAASQGAGDFSDAFADAVSFAGDSGTLQGSNAGASVELMEPLHAGKVGGLSVWSRWIAPDDGVMQLTTSGSSFDTLIGVYSGDALESLTTVAGSDDDGPSVFSKVEFNVVAGAEYRIAVDGLAGASGDISLGWSFEATGEVLPSASVSTSDAAVAPGTETTLMADVDTVGATIQWSLDGVDIAGASSEVLSIPAVTRDSVGVYVPTVSLGSRTTVLEPIDLQISEHNGPVGGGPFLARGKFAEVFVEASVGAASTRQAGRISPAGFTSVAAGTIGSQILSNFGSPSEPGEPVHCGVVSSASKWFAYQAPISGNLVVSTEGSDIDTVLAVYQAPDNSIFNLELIECDDNGGADGEDSRLEFSANRGEIYYFVVASVGGATGIVELRYNLSPNLRLEMQRDGIAGDFLLEVFASEDREVAIDVSHDLVNWESATGGRAVDGVLSLPLDLQVDEPTVFYRARLADQ